MSNQPSHTEDPEAPPPTSSSRRSYKLFSHQHLATFLNNAIESGHLGSGRSDPPQVNRNSFLSSVVNTVPARVILTQLLWSTAVTFIAYAIAERPRNTLVHDFWKSKFNIPSSVTAGTGWALTVLLGFFIREASSRYNDASVCQEQLAHLLSQIVRHVRQAYPLGTWHQSDHSRFIAHLTAYPIALKMALRNEIEPSQFESILRPDDLSDVLLASSMHAYCLTVARAYIHAAEDDETHGFQTAAKRTPAGKGLRFFLMDILDEVDETTTKALRIKEFQPAAGYLNHMRIFLAIWLFFLPMTLVQSSGW